MLILHFSNKTINIKNERTTYWKIIFVVSVLNVSVVVNGDTHTVHVHTCTGVLLHFASFQSDS